MNRVPIHTPWAPRARAAARPRPSNRPPAAITGMSTASTAWATSGRVPTRPVWPPPSPPWQITASQPAAWALTACWTAPHTTMTFSPAPFSLSMIGRGTPRPATNDEAPPAMIASTEAVRASGVAASKSTPNGRSVRSRTWAICRRMKSGLVPAMPSTP
jgi:hypothetical protein